MGGYRWLDFGRVKWGVTNGWVLPSDEAPYVVYANKNGVDHKGPKPKKGLVQFSPPPPSHMHVNVMSMPSAAHVNCQGLGKLLADLL